MSSSNSAPLQSDEEFELIGLLSLDFFLQIFFLFEDLSNWIPSDNMFPSAKKLISAVEKVSVEEEEIQLIETASKDSLQVSSRQEEVEEVYVHVMIHERI